MKPALEVFYDGQCPLCLREVNMLKRKDSLGAIRFIDITPEEFDAAEVGKTHGELMEKIHARLPNGQWITGVEVFRRLYDAVGYKKSVAISRLPGITHLLEAGYALFARNRLRLTGRCDASCRAV